MLSNLVYASVPEVAVVARNHYSSLADHLGSGKDWDLSRKNGGLKLLTPSWMRRAIITRTGLRRFWARAAT
jgi:glucose-1-phosphate adenylyltransferase